MIYSFSRGWEITWNPNKEKWIYADNKKSIETERPCIRCGEMPTKEGHDACLGNLKNVKSACCGHGIYPKYIIK